MKITAEYPPLTYKIDMGKRTWAPSVLDGKRDIPGTKKALRRLWASRINGSNVWLCCLHLQSAN